MKPYILDDASAVEDKRLDLMSKILDPLDVPGRLHRIPTHSSLVYRCLPPTI